MTQSYDEFALCSVADCSNRPLARGLCKLHYNRQYRAGNIEQQQMLRMARTGTCQVGGCSGKVAASGYCNRHYKRFLAHGDPNKGRVPNSTPCAAAACDRLARCAGYCNMHYSRLKRTGSLERRLAPAGSWHLSVQGYMVGTRNGKTVLQHRWIVEQALGKPLPHNAEIHHLNGDKTDNRPCNLVVCPDKAYHGLLEARQRKAGYKGPAPLESGLADYFAAVRGG